MMMAHEIPLMRDAMLIAADDALLSLRRHFPPPSPPMLLPRHARRRHFATTRCADAADFFHRRITRFIFRFQPPLPHARR